MIPPQRLRILGLLLLLVGGGAIVNLAIAWCIAGFGADSELEVSVSYSVSGGELTRIQLAIDGRTSAAEPAPWHIGLEPPRGSFAAIRAGAGRWQCWEIEMPSGRTAATAAFGWPFPAVRCVVAPQSLGAPAPVPVLPAPAFLTDRGLFERSSGAIPISPIFPGAIFNTLLYTAALALLLLLIPLRRAHRRRRGRCPACNYDMRGIDGPCPECGARCA